MMIFLTISRQLSVLKIIMYTDAILVNIVFKHNSERLADIQNIFSPIPEIPLNPNVNQRILTNVLRIK